MTSSPFDSESSRAWLSDPPSPRTMLSVLRKSPIGDQRTTPPPRSRANSRFPAANNYGETSVCRPAPSDLIHHCHRLKIVQSSRSITWSRTNLYRSISTAERTRRCFKTARLEGEAPAEPPVVCVSARQEPRPPGFETSLLLFAALQVFVLRHVFHARRF